MKWGVESVAVADEPETVAEIESIDLLAAARTAYKARRAREKMFGASLFADPAWDLLLYLFFASEEDRGVTVSEACTAASVPTTTALRCVGYLVDRKLICRVTNPNDRRVALLFLSGAGRDKMAEFLRTFRNLADAGL